MKKQFIILFLAFIGATTIHTAHAQTYDPLAVQRINGLIANNGLQATPNAPETWEFAFWNDETPKKIRQLYLGQKNLFGNILLEGLTTLQLLVCSENYNITKLDLTNCGQLQSLSCYSNTLIELVLTNPPPPLINLYCQNNNLTELNLSNFTQLKRLKCNNNELTKLNLTNCTQLEQLDCELSGNMYFTYATVGINTPNKVELKVYPNPTTGELSVGSYQLSVDNVEVFDIYGRKQKIIINYQLSIVNSINISHLSAGIYFVKVYTDDGIFVEKVIKN